MSAQQGGDTGDTGQGGGGGGTARVGGKAVLVIDQPPDKIWRPGEEEPEELSSEEPAKVWLAVEEDHLRKMHHLFVIDQGGRTQVYESDGWRREKPVARALAAAGFGGGGARAPLKARVCPPGVVQFTRIRGFEVSPDKLDEVLMVIRSALAGNLGGFTSVLAGQVGFHGSPLAFEHVWNAAGRPPVIVRQPELVESPELAATPAPINAPALANMALQMSARRLRPDG
ncbi:MAG TPA: hypothetical protein VLS89_17700 [Candidatus Nanopelagicales bacterium]|nr:hypothetical protein [Candidatus Nanopelagicales bacterium]